jgi:flavodoxin I
MKNELTIYYATMMGTGSELADDLFAMAGAKSLNVRLRDLSETTPEELKETGHAAFIASTWGDGEPPEDVEDFWELLETTNVDLSGLNYAVFGLGDRSYPKFNAFARMLDTRLVELGACTLFSRVEADIDFEDDFEAWKPQFLNLIKERFTALV